MQEKNYRKILCSNTPANDWAEAYPIGNGRIGAMIAGSPCEEMISLNHDLLWRNYIKMPVYHTSLDMQKIKQLSEEGKWQEAEKLMKQTIPAGRCIYINPFVPAGDLYLNMKHFSDEITEYWRELDMENGIVSVSYLCDGIKYERQHFCAWEEGLFIMHLKTSEPGTLIGELSLSRILDAECTQNGYVDMNSVCMQGCYEEGKRFSVISKIFHRNGRLTTGKKEYGILGEETPEKKFGLGYVFDRDKYISSKRGCSLWFDSCDEVTIVTAVVTDDEAQDIEHVCYEKISAFTDYKTILKKHQNHFSQVFNRVQLQLFDDSMKDKLITGERVQHARQEPLKSPDLIETMFHMARYVAIASGMPQANGQISKAPINLQGLWCRDSRPAWESDYHLDLNLEMCYWPLASMGLIEYYEPLLLWVERLMPQAKLRAKDIYGCRGAAFNGCCDNQTMGGVDKVLAGWSGASAWLAEILWIYYEHNPNRELLQRLYPIFKSFADFYEDLLIEQKDNTLTLAFGSSPEMGHLIDGREQWLSSASVCELSLIRELFENLSDITKLLGDFGESFYYQNLASRIQKLPVDQDGCLQEWVLQHTEAQLGHRHRSPLITFCPGSLFTKNSPEEEQQRMVNAIEKLLEKRLSAGTTMAACFSYAWDAQILARLHKGNQAYEMLDKLIRMHALDNLLLTINDWSGERGGLQWFKGIKLFQIEAQIAFGAAVSEMFYQDNQGIITPLPAVPDGFSKGSYEGIHGRNGFLCNLYWSENKLEQMQITSLLGKDCTIHLPEGCTQFVLTTEGGEISYRKDKRVISFPTKAGSIYHLQNKKRYYTRED